MDSSRPPTCGATSARVSRAVECPRGELAAAGGRSRAPPARRLPRQHLSLAVRVPDPAFAAGCGRGDAQRRLPPGVRPRLTRETRGAMRANSASRSTPIAPLSSRAPISTGPTPSCSWTGATGARWPRSAPRATGSSGSGRSTMAPPEIPDPYGLDAPATRLHTRAPREHRAETRRPVEQGRCMTETPFFFARDGATVLKARDPARRFAMLHTPEATPSGTAFLFSHPFGEEKLWSHRVFLSFARALGRAWPRGAAFRLPRRGRQQRHDAGHQPRYPSRGSRRGARRAARARDPKRARVGLVGLRLGATLAALFPERALAASRHPRLRAAPLVFWDPVLDGEAYFQELLRSNLTHAARGVRQGARQPRGPAGADPRRRHGQRRRLRNRQGRCSNPARARNCCRRDRGSTRARAGRCRSPPTTRSRIATSCAPSRGGILERHVRALRSSSPSGARSAVLRPRRATAESHTGMAGCESCMR